MAEAVRGTLVRMTDEDREKSQNDRADLPQPAGSVPDAGSETPVADATPTAPAQPDTPAAGTGVNATERPPATPPIAPAVPAAEPVAPAPAPAPEPETAQPVQPAAVEPVAVEPAVAEPAVAEPAVAEPAVVDAVAPDSVAPDAAVAAEVAAEAVRPAPAGPDSPWQQPAGDESVQYPPAGYAAPAPGDTMVTQSLPAAGYGQFGAPPPPDAPGVPGAWGQPAPQPPSRGKRWFAAGAAAVVLVVGGGVVGGVTVNATSDGSVVESPVVSNPVSHKTGSLAKMIQQVMPTVVDLSAQPNGGASGDEGSGVIIRSDGMILTNNHVVSSVAASGGTITVTFSNGKTTTAKVVGTDATGDLAVVQAQHVSGLKVATLGDSSKLRVGDGVIAIGSPLGLQGSVSEGIVSALNRPYTASDESQDQQNPFLQNQQQGTSSYTIPNAIQTDAAINPGNSGGPLLNMSGQVVGIDSAIKGDSNIGIGFAIPINTAKPTADSLMKGDTVQHARLGVSVTDAVSASQSTSGSAQGALVASVSSGGPAAQAGLKKGDVITKVDSTTITDADSLVAAVSAHKPGDKVTITYERNGKTGVVTATLGKQTN
jgi:putative serine protease PepD